jgi:hypothetical protein
LPGVEFGPGQAVRGTPAVVSELLLTRSLEGTMPALSEDESEPPPQPAAATRASTTIAAIARWRTVRMFLFIETALT